MKVFFFSPLRTTCIVYCGVTRNSEPTTYTNPKLETSHRTKSSTQKSGLGAQLSYRHTHYGSINMDIGLQSITSLFSFYKPSLFQKGFRWLRMDFSCGNVWWRLVKSIRWLEASKSWGWMVILLHYLLDIVRLCSCFKIKKKNQKGAFLLRGFFSLDIQCPLFHILMFHFHTCFYNIRWNSCQFQWKVKSLACFSLVTRRHNIST